MPWSDELHLRHLRPAHVAPSLHVKQVHLLSVLLSPLRDLLTAGRLVDNGYC